MDIKSEVEIKEEILEKSLEDVINNESDSEWKQIQTNIFSPNIDMKKEIEIKDEEVNITEEHPEDSDQIEQKFVFQSQQYSATLYYQQKKTKFNSCSKTH
ncbi:hypothetical protein Anas_12875 [Armadillidium nasatum]|uniref:Uncharacterized protein n=1 Tax=Armadillidium nasatum TaxID=96803 RepID=A0A5N5T7D4_9CRUS|nr:hypothetical protein Anas_12875 [Armadillidium nasatum]